MKRMEKLNEIINGSQLTLVDFFATWCGPCKMMHPVLEQLKEEMGDSLRIIKIDIDKNEALMEQYRIQSVPTLMLFRKGDALWRQSGAMSLSDLKTVVNSYQE
jgi:thioredoxin 1